MFVRLEKHQSVCRALCPSHLLGDPSKEAGDAGAAEQMTNRLIWDERRSDFDRVETKPFRYLNVVDGDL